MAAYHQRHSSLQATSHVEVPPQTGYSRVAQMIGTPRAYITPHEYSSHQVQHSVPPNNGFLGSLPASDPLHSAFSLHHSLPAASPGREGSEALPQPRQTTLHVPGMVRWSNPQPSLPKTPAPKQDLGATFPSTSYFVPYASEAPAMSSRSMPAPMAATPRLSMAQCQIMNALAEKDMQRQRQGVANQPPRSSLASYHPENQACCFPSGSVKVQHNQAKPITAMTQLLDSLGWSLGNTETNALAGGQEGAAAQRGDTIGIEANVLAGASTADMSVSERLAVIPSGSDLVQLLHAAVGMPEPARSSQDLLPRVPQEGGSYWSHGTNAQAWNGAPQDQWPSSSYMLESVKARKPSAGDELQRLRSQVAGLNMRLGALEHILPPMPPEDRGADEAAKGPEAVSAPSNPQPQGWQGSGGVQITATPPIYASESLGKSPPNSQPTPLALGQVGQAHYRPGTTPAAGHRPSGMELALMKARKALEMDRLSREGVSSDVEALPRKGAIEQMSESAANVKMVLSSPAPQQSLGQQPSRYVLQGEQCSPQQIVNSLDRMTQHAAGLQARAAVAMTRASGDQAGCALPSPPSPLAQAVKDLHPSPPAATEVDGGVMDADFAKHQFDLRQSMQMYVKCGDSHIRLVDLMSVILGSSVAGEVKENIRKEIGAVEAAKKIAEAQIQQPRRHGWQEAAVKDPTCKQAEGQEGSAGAAAATGPMRRQNENESHSGQAEEPVADRRSRRETTIQKKHRPQATAQPAQLTGQRRSSSASPRRPRRRRHSICGPTEALLIEACQATAGLHLEVAALAPQAFRPNSSASPGRSSKRTSREGSRRPSPSRRHKQGSAPKSQGTSAPRQSRTDGQGGTPGGSAHHQRNRDALQQCGVEHPGGTEAAVALAQVNSNPIRDSIGGGEMSLGKQSNSAQPQRNEAAPQSSLAREAAQPLHENSTRQGPIPGPAGTCGRGGGSSFDALPDPPSFPLPERPAVFRSEAPGGSVQLPSLPIHLPDESEDKSSEALLDFSELEKEAEKAEIEALKALLQDKDLVIQQLRSEIDNRNMAFEQQLSSAASLLAANELLKEEIGQRDSTISELQERIESETDSGRTRVQQVEKELQEREWALSAMTKIRDSLEDQLQTLEAQLAESQQDLEQERKTSQAAKGEATGIDPWEAKRFKDALEASRQTEVRLQEEIEAVRAELETCKASLSEREACQDIDGQDGGKVNRDAASALTGCMHELSVLVRSIKMQVEGAGSAMDILLRDEGRVCEGEEKHLLEALLCESPQSQRSAGLPGKGIASVARKMRSDLEILRDMISNQSAEDAAGDCVIS